MNPRQKKFVKLYLSGIPAGRAYEKAGYESTGGASEAAASRMLRSAKVRDHIKTMNEKTDDETVATLKERKQTMTEIMRNTKHESPQDAIRASAELSKMDGGYEPEKHEIVYDIVIGGEGA